MRSKVGFQLIETRPIRTRLHHQLIQTYLHFQLIQTRLHLPVTKLLQKSQSLFLTANNIYSIFLFAGR